MRIRRSRDRSPQVLWFLLAGSLLLNAGLLFDRGRNKAIEAPPAAPAVEVEAPVISVATPAPTPSRVPAGLHLIRGEVEGAVSRIFQEALPEQGAAVSAMAERLWVWDLDLRKDPRKGDPVQAVVDLSEEEAVILGLTYESKKQRRTLEAWRFQPAERDVPSWFDGAGKEVPGRLIRAPIQDYEQITALLGDGRGHQGMDFKAPVGTTVSTPFAGKVRRVDWNTRYNGRSVEIERDDGVRLRFLHLDQVGVRIGQSLINGSAVGKSGNTGRSYAPHLHYEAVDARGRVIDPLSLHDVEHVQLTGADLLAFEAERDRLLGLLATEARKTAPTEPALVPAGTAP